MKTEIKKLLPLFVFLAASIVILFISIGFYAAKNYGKKYVLIFPSVDEGKYVLETRYLKENPLTEPVKYFTEELILGSSLERTKFLFTPGAKILSCFERNQVVYIDLSADIINMGHNVLSIRDGIELLKLNVLKNFTDVKEVRVFVDGKYAFE